MVIGLLHFYMEDIFYLAVIKLIACMFIISILINFNRHFNTICLAFKMFT